MDKTKKSLGVTKNHNLDHLLCICGIETSEIFIAIFNACPIQVHAG
jgi:hypothetical protein